MAESLDREKLLGEFCGNCIFMGTEYGHQTSRRVCQKNAPRAGEQNPNITFRVEAPALFPTTEYSQWCGDWTHHETLSKSKTA